MITKKQLILKISTLIFALFIIIFVSYRIYAEKFFIANLINDRKIDLAYVDSFLPIIIITILALLLEAQKIKYEIFAADIILMVASLLSLTLLMFLSWLTIYFWSNTHFIIFVSLVSVFYILGVCTYKNKNNLFFKIYSALGILISAIFAIKSLISTIEFFTWVYMKSENFI